MSFINALDSMLWHDGLFLETKTVLTNDMTVELSLALYEDNDTKIRDQVSLQFMGVENLVFTANTQELIENAQAGNINYAYTKSMLSSKKYRFTLYLIDGLISFDFEDGRVLESF